MPQMEMLPWAAAERPGSGLETGPELLAEIADI